jgi:hypothetical protein
VEVLYEIVEDKASASWKRIQAERSARTAVSLCTCWNLRMQTFVAGKHTFFLLEEGKVHRLGI